MDNRKIELPFSLSDIDDSIKRWAQLEIDRHDAAQIDLTLRADIDHPKFEKLIEEIRNHQKNILNRKRVSAKDISKSRNFRKLGI